MDRWLGKVAVVTGASSGIGAAVAYDLVHAGLTVIGLARRPDKIEELSDTLTNARGSLYARYCDVTQNGSVKAAFDWIEEEFGGVNILINNAGITRKSMLLDDDNDDALQEVISTNLVGAINCIKATFRHLKKYDANGHIININSVLGHIVPQFEDRPLVNVYPSTKHGITALTEVIRQELNFMENRKVKISCISPGMVKTDIARAGGYSDVENMYENASYLHPDNISQAVLYVLGTAPTVQVHDLIIKPIGERM